MRFVLRFAILGCIAFAGMSCKDEVNSGRICTTEARSGIHLTIRDAATNQPAASGAIAVAYDGSFSDTLRGFFPDDSLSLSGVYERPGVYTIVVTKANYHPWVQSDIVVNRDECHVITRSVTARLEHQR